MKSYIYNWNVFKVYEEKCELVEIQYPMNQPMVNLNLNHPTVQDFLISKLWENSFKSIAFEINSAKLRVVMQYPYKILISMTCNSYHKSFNILSHFNELK